ncbi:hypothetical protein V5799_027402 [Amblyomma americanum]|uniref:Uncharacterized protein n=1 Tax=Amblyomma americanum TaxID=6943 RepID=A0AAQ4DFU0_AMBAM
MAGPEAWHGSYASLEETSEPPYYEPYYAHHYPSSLGAEKKRSHQDDFLDSKPLLFLRLFTIFVVVIVGFFLAFVMVTESGLFERRRNYASSSSPTPATTKAQPPITA